MRGVSGPWVIFYVVILIFAIAFIPGMISANNSALAGFDNKGDPGYLALAIFPLIVFSIIVFKPWSNTDAD